jgi:hypothetical protein
MSTVAKMYKLYEQGATLKEVGEQFGRSESSVSACFKRAGLQTREKVGPGAQTRPRRSPADGYPVQEMYRVYQRGLTMDEVSRQFGISKPLVSILFKAAGLNVRSVGGQRAEHPVQGMYELYEQGATLTEVGEEFGITRERVRQIFNEAGMKTRSPAEAKMLKGQIERGRAEEIVDSFHRLKDLRLVAVELEVAKQTVKSVLRERLSDDEYSAIIRTSANKT